MSGKQAKREAKRLRELEKERVRQQERRQTRLTMLVILLIIVIGGVLVYVSLERPEAPPDPEELADEADDETDAEAPVDDRPIACDGVEPAGAGVERAQFSEPPFADLADDLSYQAVFETSCGTAVVDLYEDRAPLAVANMVGLAEQGYYDGLEIFRNEPSIFALQSGAGNDDSAWQTGYTFADELEAAEDEGYGPGSLAMANSGPDTNGSQFFFTYGDAGLAPEYTKFGQVVEGLDVLETIGAVPVEGDTPTERVYLHSVSIRTIEKES